MRYCFICILAGYREPTKIMHALSFTYVHTHLLFELPHACLGQRKRFSLRRVASHLRGGMIHVSRKRKHLNLLSLLNHSKLRENHLYLFFVVVPVLVHAQLHSLNLLLLVCRPAKERRKICEEVDACTLMAVASSRCALAFEATRDEVAASSCADSHLRKALSRCASIAFFEWFENINKIE